MRCPHCAFVGEMQHGACPRCGHQMYASSGPLPLQTSQTKIPIVTGSARHVVMRGDVLNKGRYRIVEEFSLPKNQQMQGSAWIASDTQSIRRRVLIRKVKIPDGSSESPFQVANAIASRLTKLSQHAGFSSVIEVFEEHSSYYLVLSHPIGESL